ncbi:hypothetical protein GTA08_BOTSDO02247 [Neofusicoccum parvum]|uniref:Uncharacterized protein n=1 Tax=Neofusicoccum parvum TaxID=310453 RepID=A0ACB5S9G3_9PEZI|nr:hypothetical protein GTA08_BOTSDO02247 [Neofusicoccum parvum]
MSSPYAPPPATAHHRPRPARHPLAASAPIQPVVPSTPPPSYTPKDPFAPDDSRHPPAPAPAPSQYHLQQGPPMQPLTAAPSSRRSSSAAANAGLPAFQPPASSAGAHQHQLHARRRSSAAARIAAASASASAPDLGRTLSREDPTGGGGGVDAPGPEGAGGGVGVAGGAQTEPPSSALHPRVAVLLGVKESFHAPLLLCRGLATAPAIWWFGRLLNYTPSATLVRLFTISAINVYTTSWWLHLSGASTDPRLLLPAWICIASTLTILYHLAHRHVNIRRETRAAVRAFWVTSTISLWLLLLESHVERGTWKVAPLVGVFERVAKAWRDARVGGGGGGVEL